MNMIQQPSTLSLNLDEMREKGRQTLFPDRPRLTVGAATCGRAAGASALLHKIESMPSLTEQAYITQGGCLGACFAEPSVDVRLSDGTHYTYGYLEPKHLYLIEEAVQGNPPESHLLWTWKEPINWDGGENLALVNSQDENLNEFIQSQSRRVTSRCGWLDPMSIYEAIALGSYTALFSALMDRTASQLIDLVLASGLRGRGGAGFPTGIKWKLAAESQSNPRFVIANADEGDPSAYMDRALLESDPHRVLEGLILAGYAIGASKGFVFIRHEYPLAVKTIRHAIQEAYEVGLFGEDILGTGLKFDIEVIESAGAFVCGEETAMIRAIEGKRGEPYPRPPYPVEKGLWGYPTLINNPETLANVPWIVEHGIDVYRQLGTDRSPGTKIFCLAGDIHRSGFIEVPLGINLTDLVEKIGGGVENGIPKAIQIGGPSGGILPYESIALDYDTLSSRGAMIGSGGMVILDSRRCLVDLARHMVDFMAKESCGKCVACRDGLTELHQGLVAIVEGRGTPEILDWLLELSDYIEKASLCGLGKTATNPVVSSVKYFKQEYEAHIRGNCPALHCKELVQFTIDANRCQGCRCCYPNCPTNAIRGRFGKPQTINENLCIQCRVCREYCPYEAMQVISGAYEGKL